MVLFVLSGCLGFAAQRGLRAQSGESNNSLLSQTQSEADRKSAGCIACHISTDEPTMHPTKTVRLGCSDCHGGDFSVRPPAGAASNSTEYNQAKNKAHPQPRIAEFGRSSADPVRAYTKWLRESYDYVRFVNPGDLRVAQQTCGSSGCHASEVFRVKTSMMTHGGMLWGAALYNNGAFPLKNTRFGESYAADGAPQILNTIPPPTEEETRTLGVLPTLSPLERWEISQPGNVLRVFERGGSKKGEIGNPEPNEESGRRMTNWASADLVHCCEPIQFFWVCRKRGCSILFFRCREQMISRAITGRVVAQPAMWCMPMIGRPSTLVPIPLMAIWEKRLL